MVLSSLLLPSLHTISFGRLTPPIFSARIRSTASLESEIILGAREGGTAFLSTSLKSNHSLHIPFHVHVIYVKSAGFTSTLQV